MINIIIIEDEAPARRKLHRFLGQLNEKTCVIAEFETVADAVAYLKNNINDVQLILSDISLRDGNAFGIYEHLSDLPPIIFTTAYNEYMMNAFETNGIAYLLKPYTLDQFKTAWQKFLRFGYTSTDTNFMLNKLSNLLEKGSRPSYKKRFPCKLGREMIFIEVENICYFLAEESVVFAVDSLNHKYMLSQSTLKEIINQVDPVQFFQINRSEMVNILKDLNAMVKTTLQLSLEEFLLT
jgi:DNA-binding LytR/AlgR family response regulator